MLQITLLQSCFKSNQKNENASNYIEIVGKIYKFAGSGALVEICEQLTKIIQNQFKFNKYNDDDKQFELLQTTKQKWTTKLNRLPLTNTVDYSSIFDQKIGSDIDDELRHLQSIFEQISVQKQPVKNEHCTPQRPFIAFI